MLHRSRRNFNGDGKRSETKPKKTKIKEIETDRQRQTERQRERKSYPAIHSVEHKVGSRRGDQVRRCCCYDEEQQKWQAETPLQELHCCYRAAARLPQNRGKQTRGETRARRHRGTHTRERDWCVLCCEVRCAFL
jgi:hypothetical protein